MHKNFVMLWSEKLGTDIDSIKALKGGINNYVYKIKSGNRSWVVKGYPALNSGERDRMKAEVDFLKHSARFAPEYVPAIKHVDEINRCIILEDIKGHCFTSSKEITREHLNAAANFIRKINSNNDAAENIVSLDAAEGFLRITEHLQNISDRIERMKWDHLPECLQENGCSALISLKEKYSATKNEALKSLDSLVIDDCIKSNERCISPSDFGFHNAIMTNNGVVFIDFEFAGWDDPAKMVIDFALQPRIRIKESFPSFLKIHKLERTFKVAERIRVLLPVLRCKWACIILAVLDFERFEKIREAKAKEEILEIMSRRLSLARKYLFDKYDQERLVIAITSHSAK
jgi:thiamine kinase-like enzyme